MAAGTITAVTSILGLLLSAAGTGIQASQDREFARSTEAFNRQQLQQQERQRRGQLGLTFQALEEGRQERERAWKWKEEDRDYNRKQLAINRTLETLNRIPRLQNAYLDIWGRRS